MADQQRAPVQTTPTALVFAKAVIDDWGLVGEGVPPKCAAAVLYAQFMIETGGINCYNWNIGNVKHVTGDGFDYHCLHGVWEGEGPTSVTALLASGEAYVDPNASHQASCKPLVSMVFNPPHPATRFRAYDSLADAMKGHFLLLCKGRYANCWSALLAGDVMAFAHAIKARGYMTSEAEPYGNGMTPPFKHFMADTSFEMAVALSTPEAESPTVEEVQDMPILHPSIEFEPIVYTFDAED